MRGTVLLVLIPLWIQSVLAINYYKQGDFIPVYYNKIFSLQNPLAYSYNHLSFVCPPQQDSRTKSLLVFDQDLRGDRLVQSDYKVDPKAPNVNIILAI
jgi:hypothetical protein